MLKGATVQNLQYDTMALVARMLLAMTIGVTRFRRALDDALGEECRDAVWLGAVEVRDCVQQ